MNNTLTRIPITTESLLLPHPRKRRSRLEFSIINAIDIADNSNETIATPEQGAMQLTKCIRKIIEAEVEPIKFTDISPEIAFNYATFAHDIAGMEYQIADLTMRQDPLSRWQFLRMTQNSKFRDIVPGTVVVLTRKSDLQEDDSASVRFKWAHWAVSCGAGNQMVSVLGANGQVAVTDLDTLSEYYSAPDCFYAEPMT